MDDFKLKPDQVPPPPQGDTLYWRSALRWIVMVADESSNEFKWACRLIRPANEQGLTLKQHEVGVEIFQKTYEAWKNGALDCQMEISFEEAGTMIEAALRGGE